MHAATANIHLPNCGVAARVGIGYCSGHFGELLQGAFTDTDGSIVRGLVTLPYPMAGVIAHVTVTCGVGSVQAPSRKRKTADLVRGYLGLIGLSGIDCVVQLSSRLVEGIGMGSSTADLVATVRALDLALGVRSDDATIARLVVKIEVASDPTMFFGHTLLFAQRKGRILEDYGPALPPMELVGFNLAPGATFPTAETPPAAYSSAEVDEFDELRKKMRRALGTRQVTTLAEVATDSACINQRHFPKPRFNDFLQLGRDFGAKGVSVAHSGTLGTLIYDAEEPCDDSKLHALKSASTAIGYDQITVFRT